MNSEIGEVVMRTTQNTCVLARSVNSLYGHTRTEV